MSLKRRLPILGLFLILLSGVISFADLPSPLLVIDAKNVPTLPKRFRLGSSPYLQERMESLTEKGLKIPTREGLAELNISGSAQFSEKQFQQVIEQIPASGPIYLVDLREENHGFFNGDAISWYGNRNLTNAGLTLNEITAREKSLLEKLRDLKSAVIYQIKEKISGVIRRAEAQESPVSSVMSEAKLAHLNDMHYIRFPVSDREAPTQEIIEQFVNFVASLPAGARIHFHCRAGHGRTTTFMILSDILKNGHHLSFEDIVYRQYLLGGMNAFHESGEDEDEWKRENAQKRLQTLKNFYQKVTGKVPL